MMFRLLMVGLVSICLTGTAGAQTSAPAGGHAAPPDPFRLFSDKELATLSSGKGALTLSTLADHENFYVLVAGRTGPGEVEVHEHWIDYMVIQQGEADFTYGGSLTGAHDTAPGEKRGGTITGGTAVTLRPGDFLMVPAGQPHVTMTNPAATSARSSSRSDRKNLISSPLVGEDAKSSFGEAKRAKCLDFC
jgi:mannose-6-phosphate isomerase-like protein (cupin superfamily)